MTEEFVARWALVIGGGLAALWALWTWLDRKIDLIEGRLTGHGERIAALEARRCDCEEDGR
jgi:hypothetical protein